MVQQIVWKNEVKDCGASRRTRTSEARKNPPLAAGVMLCVLLHRSQFSGLARCHLPQNFSMWSDWTLKAVEKWGLKRTPVVFFEAPIRGFEFHFF